MADLARYVPRLAALYRQLPKPSSQVPMDLSEYLEIPSTHKPKLRLCIVPEKNEDSLPAATPMTPISQEPQVIAHVTPTPEVQLRVFGDTTIPILLSSNGRFLTLT